MIGPQRRIIRKVDAALDTADDARGCNEPGLALVTPHRTLAYGCAQDAPVLVLQRPEGVLVLGKNNRTGRL